VRITMLASQPISAPNSSHKIRLTMMYPFQVCSPPVCCDIARRVDQVLPDIKQAACHGPFDAILALFV
jgi:hypothetical protein